MIDNAWLNLMQVAIEVAYKETGIQLNEKNYSMMEARLSKRIHLLKFNSPTEYLNYFEKNKLLETPHLIALLTTHHTSFFREYFHFEDIENKYIAKIVETKKGNDKTIRIWSAACSQGQECYSLSMFFDQLKKRNLLGGCNYKILGTDVDEQSVNYGKNGVYQYKELMQSPLAYIHGNWLRGMKEIKDFVKPKLHIKEPLKFEVANLLNLGSKYTTEKQDIIFCRNVLIYFNSSQIQVIIQSLLSRLAPNGILVLGISESIQDLKLPVKLLLNNIYCHDNIIINMEKIVKAQPTQEKKSLWKIMCVDDSPTILALMKKILTKEKGFEIIATAASAQEAREKLKTLSVDLMTLDIHMEHESGLEYLKKDFIKGKHPTVVMISSTERDGATAPKEALRLGASDYIEKPGFKDLDDSGDEIRFKIKTILELATKAIAPQATSYVPQLATAEKSVRERIITPQEANTSRIKVLIVDDAPTIRVQLKKMLSSCLEIEVIGDLGDPRKIEEFILKSRPDVITLDINMPYMNGVDVIKKIISKYPIPTIVISSLGLEEGNSIMEALEHGAVDYFQKPGSQNIEEEKNLIEKIKQAKHAKVRVNKLKINKIETNIRKIDKNYLIAIGSSTGGTEAIKCILECLPENIPPILIVQHIPPLYSKAFADRLNNLMPFEVLEAKDQQPIKENCVYIAPGGMQMTLIRSNNLLKIQLKDDEKCNGHKPSVDILFNSIVDLKLKKTVGIILTGMGNDGAKGLKKMHDSGSKTIAQNENTCVVFGMPKEAIKLNAVDYTEPIEDIANRIMALIES